MPLAGRRPVFAGCDKLRFSYFNMTNSLVLVLHGPGFCNYFWEGALMFKKPIAVVFGTIFYNIWGNVKYRLFFRKSAIADYDRAIEINPDYAKAYTNRGKAKYKLGDYHGAIADYDRTIELKPDYAKAYYNRGEAKHKLGDERGAKADRARAQCIELDPMLEDR